MNRTSIMLPEGLKARASHYARELGVSLGELIRESLEGVLKKKKPSLNDDLFWADRAVAKGPKAGDAASKHDEYLYGDKK